VGLVLRIALKAGAPALAVLSMLLVPGIAEAQRTRFQAINQCTRQAAAQFGRTDPSFRRFVIERMSVHEDRFAGHVGNQFVSTVFHGRAIYEGSGGPKRVRFICLHASYSKGAVFVYALPE
jgi:hypothetical protein